MTTVGRNEPCPCGSGLKFKRCCLNKTAASAQSYSSVERDSALAKLMRFSARAEFKEVHRTALRLFWGERLSDESDEVLSRVMDSEQATLAYHSWFVFDFDLGKGRTMLDLFLQREGKNLRSGERDYLEGMVGSHLRLYEVLDVKLDEGMEIRDLWEDRRLWVRERSATRQIVAWDLIVARTGPAGDGETVLETLPYLFPAAAKDDLVAGLKKSHRLFIRERPQENIIGFFKSMAPVFHQLWLERAALRPAPKIMTAEGDPFIFAKVVFDLLDRDSLTKALANHPDIIDHGDGSYAWLEEGRVFQRSLGTIVVDSRRVVFETTSRQRAERGKDFLDKLLGKAAKFKAISYEDVGQALKRAPASAMKESPGIPPEVQAELLGRFYEQHYGKWLDEPVPALGNRTPRHAVKLKTVRPKVIALLKDFESHSERQRRAGKPAYDFGWMWKELGLTSERGDDEPLDATQKRREAGMDTANIYQLKITLAGSHPPIWRRVQVPGDLTLAKLHWVIQAVMGWYDSHLHQFIVGKAYYGDRSIDEHSELGIKDERKVKLCRVLSKPQQKIVYEYDFGDGWKHQILLEEILEPKAETRYPVCVAGMRACPPEDVGGIHGYANFLEALNDPEHEEHDEYLEWIGGEFDPEEFNPNLVNASLRRIV